MGCLLMWGTIIRVGSCKVSRGRYRPVAGGSM
jgi:hypothetical protein